MSVADSPALQTPAVGNMRVTEPGEAHNSFDIVQILWRWKWLPILGSIIGAGLGYLYFSKQPAIYQATALVQVATSLPGVTSQQVFNAEEMGPGTRADESMVIRSQKVLRVAVNRGRLTDQPLFAGESAEEIVARLMSSDDLLVEPADKDDATKLISISYLSEDADLAAIVVNAIVDGYSEYLSEEYQTVGNEIYNLVTDAQEKLQKEHKNLNQQSLDFQKQTQESANVVWTSDGVRDPYAEEYFRINAELSNIVVRKQKIAGTVKQAKDAIAAGRPADVVLMMLVTEYDGNNASAFLFGSKRPSKLLEGPDFDKRVDTIAERMEREQLVPLEIRQQELLNNYGDGHPSVELIKNRIAVLKSKIEEQNEKERLFAEEEEKLLAEASEEDAALFQTMEQRLQTRILALEEELASLSQQENFLKPLALAKQKQSNQLQLILGRNKLIDSEIETIKTLLTSYTEKLQQIEFAPNSGQRTLKALNLPTIGGFYGPSLAPYLLGGAAVGFVLLSGLAVLMDLADRSYRNPEEIANDLGVAVLGHVPVMDISKVKKTIQDVDPSVTSIHHSKGRVSEAYRSVRTGLYFSQNGQNLKVIQVTSPVPGDGKSTLSSNLAVSMAQSGRRVLLIDADFRRPRIAKIFGIDAKNGMATVIAGKAELDEAIYDGPVANLSIMPGGKRPNNPAELLSSQRFADLVELLREKFDMIVIDTPPLLAVSDPGAVAGLVDGVVLTMRLRRNVKPLAMRATSILESVGAKCLGVVVNGVSSEAGYGYNYDYNDYRYAYKYGSNYRSGYGYRYGYGNYRYGYSSGYDDDLSTNTKPSTNVSTTATQDEQSS
ncbi:MAG: polysaccharide biosynthesis tyrosine autokinase [Aureliella sp.]